MRRVLLPLIAASALALSAAPALALPPVGHVFVIVLENKGVEDTFGPTGQLNAPYLARELPAQGQLMLRYYGVGHSSADNTGRWSAASRRRRRPRATAPTR